MRIHKCLPTLLLAAAPVLFSNVAAQSFQANQAYTNQTLGLAFRYPAAFNKESPEAVSKYEGAMFALHAEADPAHLGADPCAPVLLTLGANLDRPTEVAKKGQPPIYPSKGTLTLSEVSRTCLDKDALDDATLSAIVAVTANLEGMRPLGRVRNDLVAGSTIWWAASAGYNRNVKGKRTADAGTLILGTAAAVVNGHILVWSVSANDPVLFNRLTSLAISTDGDNYSQLLHFQLNVPRSTDVASR